ncbi:MAG: FAD-binding protein [Desulfobacteraceae bacterium]|jgi:succinate dehydrogenase/fumarate reductase flavoprotein subunit
MTNWHDFVDREGTTPSWPYPVDYEKENEIDTDVLIIGGGIAGCWAAISAARKGVRVALVEKGDTVRSGAGGPGCDHWGQCPANPHSKVDPDEWAKIIAEHPGTMAEIPKDMPEISYGNGIGSQIQCRESYDTLLEQEEMGGQIRDINDEYVGAEGRYDDTKFMISPRTSPDHANEIVIRIWGTTFKLALKKECQRLGVQIFDRVMVTSLLTEDGQQGARVVGATGFNNRTGEFMIFRSKASVLAAAGDFYMWMLNTEHAGCRQFRSRNATGDGLAMAWKAGAELVLMEKTVPLMLGTGYKHNWYGGAGDASYENLQLVDANGKKLPWPTQGWADGGAMFPKPDVLASIRKGIFNGEWALPFYGDFPAMPDIERRTTWDLMLGQESTTKVITSSYERAGFDPSTHLLQNYAFIEGENHSQWRTARGGGPVVDWNLKTTLDGLYAAGEQLFSFGDHSFAATTGRYAGRKAADCAAQAGESKICWEQVDLEKNRVYAPVKRTSGIEWKELNAGIARTMQYFCSEYKTELLFTMGLDTLKEIEEVFVPTLYARDPHKLMRSIEDLSMLTHAQMVLHASLARKASSRLLNFYRIDYPEIDPPEWSKFVTIKQENGEVKTGELPLRFWGDMKAGYEAHNRDYSGVYKSK